MFAQYSEYYAIILRGAVFFVDTLYKTSWQSVKLFLRYINFSTFSKW